MKTPIIIAAYNEAERIGATLRGLDAATTEPFVIVNGEEGFDETIEEALRYTPNVLGRPEQGKLPAIQAGLQRLLNHDTDAFSKPIIFTDADSRPLLSAQWAPTLSLAVAGELPRSAAGIAFLNEGDLLDCTLRSARRFMQAKRAAKTYSLDAVYGANMALNFAGDTELIDRVMDLPHIWPAEDRYLAHIVAGEEQRFTQLVSFGSAILTSARYLSPLRRKLFMSESKRAENNHDGYTIRKADGATHYFDQVSGLLVEHE
jgi:glycosyltransferase involved in cell wall biosynthesis